jgi:hypothetical protein
MKPIDIQAAAIQWGIEIETRIPDSSGIAVGPYPNGAYEVSVAHYSEQNGNAMRDPEITFRFSLPTMAMLGVRSPSRTAT